MSISLAREASCRTNWLQTHWSQVGRGGCEGGQAATLISTQTGLLLLFLGKKEKGGRRREEGMEGWRERGREGGREEKAERAERAERRLALLPWGQTPLDGVWVQTSAPTPAGAGVPVTPFGCNRRLSPQRWCKVLSAWSFPSSELTVATLNSSPKNV